MIHPRSEKIGGARVLIDPSEECDQVSVVLCVVLCFAVVCCVVVLEKKTLDVE